MPDERGQPWRPDKDADIHLAAGHTLDDMYKCLADFTAMGTRPDKVDHYQGVIAEMERRGLKRRDAVAPAQGEAPNPAMRRFPLKEVSERGLPSVVLELPRVTVILGRNGAGKSTVMERLNDACARSSQRRRVVSGNVRVELPGPGFHPNDWQNVRADRDADSQFENTREKPSGDRALSALATLFNAEKRARLAYHEERDRAEESGGRLPAPEPPKRPFQEMKRILKEFIPDLTISEQLDPPKFTCVLRGNSFATNRLSAGEQHILFLVADLLGRSHPDTVVLVDEPELHLNSGLACRLWTRIEAALPNCWFIHATHSPDFASRNSVEQVLLVQDGGAALVPLDGCQELDASERREFFGAIPGVLLTNGIVVVEGTQFSADSRIVSWVLRESHVHVQPVGECRNVLAAVRGAGPWVVALQAGRLIGIVDRDHFDEARLGGEPATRLFQWPLHEVESVLCLPEVLMALAGRRGRELSILEAENAVLTAARGLASRAAACRTAVASRLGVTVSQTTLLIGLEDEELLGRLLESAERARGTAERVLGAEQVRQTFRTEQDALAAAIGQREVSTVLARVDGKALASTVLQSLGLGTARSAIEELCSEFRAADFPPVAQMRSELERMLAAT